MSGENIENLPKWAQNRIRKLEGEVRHWKELAEGEGEGEGLVANLSYDDNGNRVVRAIPSTVGMPELDLTITVRRHDDTGPLLEVNLGQERSLTMVVMPVVSNVARIGAVDLG